MYDALKAILSRWTGLITSDDIYANLCRSYSDHQIAGITGYARRDGRLQIVGSQKSERTGKRIHVFKII